MKYLPLAKVGKSPEITGSTTHFFPTWRSKAVMILSSIWSSHDFHWYWDTDLVILQRHWNLLIGLYLLLILGQVSHCFFPALRQKKLRMIRSSGSLAVTPSCPNTNPLLINWPLASSDRSWVGLLAYWASWAACSRDLSCWSSWGWRHCGWARYASDRLSTARPCQRHSDWASHRARVVRDRTGGGRSWGPHWGGVVACRRTVVNTSRWTLILWKRNNLAVIGQIWSHTSSWAISFSKGEAHCWSAWIFSSCEETEFLAFSNILPAMAIALRKVGGEGVFFGSLTAEVGLFGRLRLRGIAAKVCRSEMNFLTTSLYCSCARVEKMQRRWLCSINA